MRKLTTLVLAAVAAFASPALAEPSHVALVKSDAGGGFSLTVNGQPYFINGAGGDASRQVLKDAGGNSFRTWGADDIGDKLDEAQKLGLTVTVGIWLKHEDKNFNYNNARQVGEQYETARQAILKYKDHPALLMWAIGNEMEGYKKGDNAAVWSHVEAIAAMAHKLDPNHPTMTVIAEIGGERVPSINALCPDIDVIGINSYGGGPSLAQRYHEVGGVKPFVVTEFGPPGQWEVGKNAWGAPLELTSTQKGDSYRATYEKTILAEKGKLSLGSYAFAWGNKQEATATWYGIFLPDGTRLEALDTLTDLWSGKKVPNRCPQIRPLKVDGPDRVGPGETIKVKLDVTDPENDPMTVKWVLTQDPGKYNTGGETQAAPPSYPDAIAAGDLHDCELHMPKDGGGYWLYAYVKDDHGGGAVADLPLYVNGPTAAKAADAAADASLPPVPLYEDGLAKLPYIPSGWMGKTDAIGMDEKCTINPHSGATCMKCEFRSNDNFGGIIWQDPPNDWGDQPGGRDLTGYTKLTFWARGEHGGETVSFKLGIIGKDKPHPDSASAELNDAELTTDWKQYTIDLTGKDLSHIKTGFGWVVAGKGKPITFYLDDIKYEQ